MGALLLLLELQADLIPEVHIGQAGLRLAATFAEPERRSAQTDPALNVTRVGAFPRRVATPLLLLMSIAAGSVVLNCTSAPGAIQSASAMSAKAVPSAKRTSTLLRRALPASATKLNLFAAAAPASL